MVFDMNWFYVDMDSLIESYYSNKEENDEFYHEDCADTERC